jgi:hypothetical protein
LQFGRSDNIKRRSVFDGAAGIEPFRFGKQLHLIGKIGRFGNPPQLEKGRVANLGFQAGWNSDRTMV